MKVMTRVTVALVILLTFALSSCFLRSTTTTTSNSNAPDAGTNSNAAAEPAGTPNAGSAQSPATLPETLVSELYKAHDAKKSPFFQTKDRALVDKYFTKPLADLIWKDATSSKNEVGAIDGDPLYDTQDPEIKNFAVGKGDVKGDKATVAVTFTNADQKVTVNFSLVISNGNWKIDDIRYSGGDSLMKWLKETYDTRPAASPAGTFSGTYQVGPTTCSVRQAKQSYEVRWAKGSGVEVFYEEGDNTFSSNPTSGDPNHFEFDDSTYTTGKFLRADGTTFPVKRQK